MARATTLIPTIVTLVLFSRCGAVFGAPPSFRSGCAFTEPPDFNACETDDAELHALGIYWAAGQPGMAYETGIHLRWSFDPDTRHYPTGGFEVQRRSEGAHDFAWRTLATVYPATDADSAIARIPASLTAVERCAYEAGAEDLVDLLEFIYCDDDDGIDSYWRFEGSQDLFYEAALGYVNWKDGSLFDTSGDPPPLGFELIPREFLLLTCIDPVVARIAGLYYVDKSARPDLRYDYRIVGHYSDRTLCAVVRDVGSATTRPLNPPGLNAAGDEIEALQGDALGIQVRGSDPDTRAESTQGETWVELEWSHEAREVLAAEDELSELVPIRYLIERRPSSGGAFSRIPAGTDSVSGCRIFAAPVVIPQVTAEDGSSSFKSPPYYRDFTVSTGMTYAYQVTGVDVFGRYSPAAESDELTIEDRSPPPAPIVTEARFFQRESRSSRDDIEQDLRGLSLPEIKEIRHAWARGSVDVVLRVRWLWPVSFRDTHGDTEGFRVYVSAATLPVETVGVNAFTSHIVPTAEDPGVLEHEYFERHIPIARHIAEAPISDETRITTTYYDVHVTAVDSSGNESLVLEDSSGRVVNARRVVLRDITPPNAPTSLPNLAAELPELPPPDVEGRVALRLEWSALANLSYRIVRADERTVCSAMIASGTPVPVCGNVSDSDLQDFLVSRPDLFEPVSGAVLGSSSTSDGAIASYIDLVQGKTAGRYVYALKAMDPAGNTSDVSAPGEPIFVPDRFPPAKPVIARAFAGSGEDAGRVSIEWSRGRETDLSSYVLYRAASDAYSKSKRRMNVVCEVAASTSSYDCVDVPPHPEHLLYYRLEAVDTSGNHSLLSETAAVKALDIIPPSMSGWAASLDCSEGVTLTVTPPTGTSDEFRVVRQQSGHTVALTGWTTTGFTGLRDATSSVEFANYFLQIRDQAGNVTMALIDNPCSEGGGTGEPEFIRGDADADGSVAISDAIGILGYLYLGMSDPVCLDAADTDDSGTINLTDPVRLLSFLFLGGAAPAAPYPACGIDPEDVGCGSYPPCE